MPPWFDPVGMAGEGAAPAGEDPGFVDDGHAVDHAPLDVHVGSIAIERFIRRRSPLVTLHGHVHESARLTGAWRARIGRTHAFSAAHDGPELALISFDPERPGEAMRVLL